MKDLADFKVLDEVIDNYKNPMKVVSFTIEGYKSPFKYLNCFCPSTKRDYFIETKQDKCELAKAESFGLNKVKFDQEW